MINVPLGHGAYKRLAAGTPEIQVENRWLESNPTNLEEQTMLLSRPGTTKLVQFPTTTNSPPRGNFTKVGLFNNDLFVVSGFGLFRISQATNLVTPITGLISFNNTPQSAWMKGIGYEYLFITAGDQLQVYMGTSSASVTLSTTGTITSGSDTFEVGGMYYQWNNTPTTGNGTLSTPWLVKITNSGTVYDPLNQLALAITATGIPGTDYSPGITTPNTLVTIATNTSTPPATYALLTALTPGTSGNLITSTIQDRKSVV